ncbi:MAG: DUF4097 family beta strand repeat protein [Phycisphaerae bacterium]|jgi:hypothetical protein|nr:DUF4097 family beta strand repeat protein [Phycisphaerae bacterium]
MRRSLQTLLVSVIALSTAGLTACIPLDGKAERSFTASEAKPSQLVIEARFLDVDLSVAKDAMVAIDAKVILKTNGGNETAEREIEKCVVRVEREGDTLYIRQGKKDERLSVSSYSGSGFLKVALPADVPFRISTASGNVAMNGDFGSVAAVLQVASGDVNGDLGVGSFVSESASGDTKVALRHPVTMVECDTASGDIAISAPSIAKAKLASASGDVSLRGMAGPLTISVASGDVDVTFVEFPASAVTAVETASGDIVIRLPSGAAPSGAITTASGEIKLGVPGTTSKRGATLTGSGAAITASAASGDVRISAGTP